MEALNTPVAVLETLFDLLPTGALLLLPVYEAAGAIVDFTFFRVNPAAQRLLSLPPQPTRTMMQAFPHNGPSGVLTHFRQAFTSGEHQEFLQLYQGDGLDSSYHLVVQRSGEHLVVLFADLAERTAHDMRQQLHETTQELHEVTQELHEVTTAAQLAAASEQARLLAIFAQAPLGIGLFEGPAQVVTLANPDLCAILGRPAEQLLGKPFLEAVPEARGQGFDQLLAEVARTGEPFRGHEMPVELRQANGHLATRYFNFVYEVLRDAAGQSLGVLDISIDVTEQVLARQQVEQRVQARTQEAVLAQRVAEVQRQRLEQLFMHAPAAICILDGPDLVYELVNPSYQQLFPGRALQGLPLLEALPELTDQPVWHTLQQVYRTGQTHLELGICIPVARTEGGPLENFYFNYIQQARFGLDGQIDGVVVFAFDVTDQMLARQQVQALNEELAVLNEELTATNEELHESNARLIRTNADLDTFVYTASHDLQAPITNIEGLLDALRQELPASVTQGKLVTHLLSLMRDSVARFQQTLQYLTDIAHAQHASGGAQRELIELAALVESVRLDLAPAFEASRGELHVDVQQCRQLVGAPKDIRSIVFNLVSNALKYRHPNRPPVVQITTRCEPQQMVLEVRDNGLGLTTEQRAELFHLFRRLHTHVEGSGVGLYSIKKLITNAGGSIDVASEIGEGSTFTVRLPQWA